VASPLAVSGANLRPLDPASRLALTTCLRRTSLLLSLVLWPYATGAWTLGQSMEALGLWLSANAVISALVARWRGEPFNAGSLNHWDEFFLCLALARLAHMVQVYPA